MDELMLEIGLLCVMGFAMVGAATVPLHIFVALKAKPLPRAAWTVGLAYLIVSASFLLGALPGYELYGPFLSLPGALIAFWFWRGNFRRGWVEQHEITEGMVLEDDDWRVGLRTLLGHVASSVARTATRRSGPD